MPRASANECDVMGYHLGDNSSDASALVRSESYYASEFNAPRARPSSALAESKGEVKWQLVGFNPPKRLRVPGYAYVLAEDSVDDARRRERGAHEVIIPRTIHEHEVMFTEEANGEDAPSGGLAHAYDDDARRRTTTTPGGMSSRPSWGENAYSASQQVRA